MCILSDHYIPNFLPILYKNRIRKNVKTHFFDDVIITLSGMEATLASPRGRLLIFTTPQGGDYSRKYGTLIKTLGTLTLSLLNANRTSQFSPPSKSLKTSYLLQNFSYPSLPHIYPSSGAFYFENSTSMDHGYPHWACPLEPFPLCTILDTENSRGFHLGTIKDT